MRCAALVVAVVALVAAASISGVDAVPMARLRVHQQQLSGRSSVQQQRRAGAPPRDTSAGVALVRDFDKSLNIAKDRQAAKEQLLSSDAFVFFRASPKLYHSDVSRHPLNVGKNAHAKAGMLRADGRAAPSVPTGNDIHAANFGTFRAITKSGGAGDGAFFGINDYDQATSTAEGVPLDVDLTRFATSMVLAARKIGATAAEQQALAGKVFDEYFEEATELIKDGPKPPFLTADNKGVNGKIKALIENAAKAKRKDFLDKYSKGTGARRTLLCDDPKEPDLKSVKDAAVLSGIPGMLPIHKSLSFTAKSVLQVCEKLNSGGSSFGLPRYWVLTANSDVTKEPFIFEVKQLLPPAVKPGTPADGTKLLAGQTQLMGGFVPNTVRYATATWDKKAYLIREVEPEKDSLKLDKASVADLQDLVQAAAKVLARAHTQGGEPARAREIADVWMPKPDRPAARTRLIAFATAYADQVAADHAAYKAAVASGKF